VSTLDQRDNGHSLAAQRQQIETVCAQREWHHLAVFTDAASGKSMDKRPALRHALELLARSEADALVVAKLDRLSRSVSDFSRLIERARSEKWKLVVLDPAIDTTTDSGEFVANLLANVAQYEARLVSSRTKAGLEAARAKGIRLGRPWEIPEPVVRKIVRLRSLGLTLQEVCDSLTMQGIPTARPGSQWWPSTIKAVLDTREPEPSL